MSYENPPGDPLQPGLPPPYGSPGFGPHPYGPPPGFGPPGFGPAAYGAPVPTPRPPRPVTVTIAVALMFVQVGLQGVAVAANIATTKYALDAVPEVDRRGVGGMLMVAVTPNACFALGVIAALLVLGVLNMRGNYVSRILTWVGCGLYFCCTSFAGGIAAIRTGESAVPTWLYAITLGTAGLTLVLVLGIAVLLAQRASNAYFNPKPQAQPY